MIKSSKKFRITVDAPEVLDITRNVDDTVQGGDTGLELADRYGVKHTYDYPNDFINPRDVGIQVNSDQIPYSNEFPPSGYINNVPPHLRWVYTHATGGWWQGVYYPPNSTPPGYTAPTTPTPSPTTQFPDQAKGIITQVNVPTSTGKGLQFQIEIILRNIGGKDGKFSAKVDIPALGLTNQATASVYLPPFNTGRIRKTLLMPSNAAENQLYPASIVLNRHDLTTGDITEDDTEVSTIPGPNVTVPTTPTPDLTEYWSLVRKKCDPNTTLYAKEWLESQGIQVVEYKTNPAELITCTACGCLHGWIVIKINKSPYATSFLTSLGFVPGIVTSGGGTPTPDPTPTPTASIILSKTSIPKGSNVSVLCTNFGSSEIIDFTAKIGSTVVGTDNKQTTSSGSVVLDDVDGLNNAPAGTVIITAKGRTSGRTATATLTITTTTTTTVKITLSASSVQRGKSITVTGTGFKAGEVVGIWSTPNSNPSLTIAGANPVANTTGTAVTTITFSTSAPLGTATVFALGRTSGRKPPNVSISVLAATTTTTTAKLLGPASVHDGDSFTITGSGFKAGEQVDVRLSLTWSGGRYNGKSYSYSRTPTASSSGKISTTLKTEEVPSGVTSTAKITAKGRTSGLTATWSVKIL